MTDTDTDGPASPHPPNPRSPDTDFYRCRHLYPRLCHSGLWGKVPATDSLCNGHLSKNCPNRCMQLQTSITPCWAKPAHTQTSLPWILCFLPTGQSASHTAWQAIPALNQPCAHQLAHMLHLMPWHAKVRSMLHVIIPG